ncbi:hypothetical protein HZA87_01415 [Candidatus Uhrbacteria bacterium]|nr:hypothetical protein [Candidatus Uhrbacteria bacterium]
MEPNFDHLHDFRLKTEGEKSEVDHVENEVRNRIKNIFERGEKISDHEVKEVRELLARIPNLVINFDDTITRPPEKDPDHPEKARDNYSIRGILREVEGLCLAMDDKARFEHVKNMNLGLGGRPPESITACGGLIPYFYQKVLGGLTRDQVNAIYDDVVNNTDPHEQIALNGNFVMAIRVIAQKLGITRIPLFVLSLNTPELTKKWYDKHLPKVREVLQVEGIDVDVVELMGNQIVWGQNETGQEVMSGVIQHVTNDNKDAYIPVGTIMLADNRETEKRAEKGTNVVNIQGGNFSNELLVYSIDYQLRAGHLRSMGIKLETNPDEVPVVFVAVSNAYQKMLEISEKNNALGDKKNAGDVALLDVCKRTFEKNLLLFDERYMLNQEER